jgi:hypothetical protein
VLVSRYPAHAASSSSLPLSARSIWEGCFDRFGVGSHGESRLAVDRVYGAYHVEDGETEALWQSCPRREDVYSCRRGANRTYAVDAARSLCRSRRTPYSISVHRRRQHAPPLLLRRSTLTSKWQQLRLIMASNFAEYCLHSRRLQTKIARCAIWINIPIALLNFILVQFAGFDLLPALIRPLLASWILSLA